MQRWNYYTVPYTTCRYFYKNVKLRVIAIALLMRESETRDKKRFAVSKWHLIGMSCCYTAAHYAVIHANEQLDLRCSTLPP